MEPLTYEALDTESPEFRLLKIRQCDDSGVCLTLTKHCMASAPKYFALSYVWGNPHVTKNITVNGMTFAATTNLVAALEAITELSKVRGEDGGVNSYSYWVDAICINQRDIQERSVQVQMMGDIFKNAHMVLAWIGPEEDGSSEAIQVINRLAGEVRCSQRGDTSFLLKPTSHFLIDESGLKPQGDEPTTQDSVSSENLGSIVMAKVRNIRSLFNKRSFWKRAWILQELVLARRVFFLCGAEGFNTDDIVVLSTWIQSIPTTAYQDTVSDSDWVEFRDYLDLALLEPIKSVVLAEQLRKNSHEDPHKNIWRTLMYARRMIASDPRDKIYSLLGLVELGIQADYSKTVQVLYLEVARILFPQVFTDKWFDRATPPRKRIQTLPSWVIDWDSRSKGHDWGITLDGKFYNAAATMDFPSRHAEINGTSLLAHGAIFDETHLLAPSCSDRVIDNAANAFQFDISAGQPHGDINFDQVPPGYARGHASLRLSLSDRAPGSSRRFAIDPTYVNMAMEYLKGATASGTGRRSTKRPKLWPLNEEESQDQFVNLFVDENVADKIVDSDDSEVTEDQSILPTLSPSSRRNQITRWAKFFRHARHFYTKKGYLGYGPDWIQESDLICVLQNCRVPVLLRKVDDHYEFISLCFVLGIMDGEVGEMVNKGEISMQTFDIQ